MKGRQHVTGRLIGWAFLVVSVLAVTVLCGQVSLAQEKFHITIYGFVQADYIQDFNRVDSNWEDTLRPSRIPTIDGEFGDDGQASMSAKQSRLGVMMDFPTGDKSLFTKFEFDMFGVGDDQGQTTIRLRHAYGRYGKWLAGQAHFPFASSKRGHCTFQLRMSRRPAALSFPPQAHRPGTSTLLGRFSRVASQPLGRAR